MSLARVLAVTLIGGAALGVLGYVLDLAASPTIGQDGWWTVFFHGGLIAGAVTQVVREFAMPRPAERAALAAESRASAPAARAEPGDTAPPPGA